MLRWIAALDRIRFRWWLVFLVLSQGIYAVMLTWTLPAIQAQAGGLPAFDLRPLGYGLPEARAFLGALSPAGRDLYLGVQLPLDFFFPPLLAALLVSSWVLLRRVAGWPGKGFGFVLAVPVLAWLADWAENAGIVLMLGTPAGAAPDPALVACSSVFTLVKSWSTVAGDVGLILYALAALGLFLARRRRRP